jgi:predicted nucleotidyltransferase
MKNTSKIKLNRQANPRLKEVLNDVDSCCIGLGIDFYILGALARDVWFIEHGIAASGTKDVDFAVFVSETLQFEELKEAMIRDHGFAPTRGNQFALIAPNGLQIDLLPFGALEVEDGVAVKGEGLNKIKVNGFKEVYLTSIEEVFVLESMKFKVATLPGILMLKLISYDDRPDQRGNDPIDCSNIILHYYEIESDLIYESHNDLFGGSESLQTIAARVIGRELRKPLAQDQNLKWRVIRILTDHINRAEQSDFILKMATYVYLGTEECVLYLSEVLKGINEPEVTPTVE